MLNRHCACAIARDVYRYVKFKYVLICHLNSRIHYVTFFGLRWTSGVKGEIERKISVKPFYRAMHFSAKRGIAIACRLSVRPSVCLSVCNVGEL